MDTQQPPIPPTQSVSKTTTSTGMFGTRIPSSVAFAIAILLFFLPFAEIKCNQTVMTNQTGLGLATGSEWKSAGGGLGGKETTGDLDTKTNGDKPGNAQYFAIAALALGVLGLLLSFTNAKGGGVSGVITGVLSAGALIGVMIELKKWFNAGLAKEAAEKAQNNTDNLGLDKLGNTLSDSFTLNFTPWFYIAVIAFLAAAVFSYLRMSSARK